MIIALIALIAILFGGSAGSAWVGDIKDPLKQHVSEKDRREAVLDESKRLVEGQKTIGDSIQKHFILMSETHLDYHSTAADFDDVAVQLKEDQARAFSLDLDVRNKMQASLSEEEWTAVFSDAWK